MVRAPAALRSRFSATGEDFDFSGAGSEGHPEQAQGNTAPRLPFGWRANSPATHWFPASIVTSAGVSCGSPGYLTTASSADLTVPSSADVTAASSADLTAVD